MNLTVVASLNPMTGYGQHAIQTVRWLEKIFPGLNVKIRRTDARQTGSERLVPEDLCSKVVAARQPERWELMLAPLHTIPTPERDVVWFTMGESTGVSRDTVHHLNSVRHVVTPSQWNASVFSASGVTTPMTVIPLGHDPDIWRPQPLPSCRQIIFGAAGSLRHGAIRKGLKRIVQLFEEALPQQVGNNVRLQMKVMDGETLGADLPTDSRVSVESAFLPEADLAKWMAQCHVWVNLASGGWELFLHQAMALGRPCISIFFGGQTEYFHDGYAVSHQLVPASEGWSGVWAHADGEAVVAAMRYAATDLRQFSKVNRPCTNVLALTWENSVRHLGHLLQKLGAIEIDKPTPVKIETTQETLPLKGCQTIGFHHGLGDCCNAATLFKAMMKRSGLGLRVACAADTAPIFAAAGCDVVASDEAEHPWSHPPYNRFPELAWSDNKTAHNAGGMNEGFWAELCATEIDLPATTTAVMEVEQLLGSNCARPLILLHERGRTSGHLKNMPREMGLGLRERLRTLLGGTILPVHCQSIGVLAALLRKADLLIGIDSGPLHLARLTGTKALGVWFGLHPTAFALPCPRIRHLCFAKHPFNNLYGLAAHYAQAGPLRAEQFNLRLVAAMTVDVIVEQAREILAK